MANLEQFPTGAQPVLHFAEARRAAQFGLLSAALFWIALVIFGTLQPGYSHAHHAVSELGAVGAAHQWAWNWLGFILPGALLAGFATKIAGTFAPSGSAAAVLMFLCGAMFAATGVFSADLHDHGSFSTRLHILASMLSLLAWLPASLFLAVDAHRAGDRGLTWISLCAALLVVTSATLGRLLGPSGVSQRLTFAAFFLWVVVVCLRLWWNAAEHSRTALGNSCPPDGVPARQDR